MLLSKNSKIKFLIGIVFGISYYLIFGLASLASGLIHTRITLAFPFESQIPFYPAWAIVYLSINLLLLSGFFIFHEWKLLAIFALTLIVETLIAGSCFIIFPIQLVYAPVTTPSHFTMIVSVAKFFSMNNNYFPSLHTAFAFTAALAYQAYCSVISKVIFFIWACAIVLSTLFIHEHQICDLVAGFVLALIAHYFVFSPLAVSTRKNSIT